MRQVPLANGAAADVAALSAGMFAAILCPEKSIEIAKKHANTLTAVPLPEAKHVARTAPLSGAVTVRLSTGGLKMEE